jgi:hypothetical protein
LNSSGSDSSAHGGCLPARHVSEDGLRLSRAGLRWGKFAETLSHMLREWIGNRVRALGWVAWALSGCAAGGVHFAGSSGPRLVAPAQLASGERPPEGQRWLGHASVECSPLSGETAFESARFSDLACSVPLLRAALREAAADAGGTFFTEPECRARPSSAALALRVTWVGCESEVWAPADRARFVAPALAPRPINVDPLAPAAPGAPAFGSVQEAWRVVVDFSPVPGPTRAPSVDAQSVAEVDFPRAGQVRLGDLSAHCDSKCSVESLRRGLRAGVARSGGTTLVGVRCIQGASGPSCIAAVAGPERDEARVAAMQAAEPRPPEAQHSGER